jgi:hypothetical protein
MFQNESKENQIRKAVEDILKRKEFQQTDERNPIADMIRQIWDSFLEWARGLFKKRAGREVQFNPSEFSQNIDTVLKIALIILAVILLFIIIRLLIKKVYLPGKVRKNKIPKPHEYLENPDLAEEKMRSLMEQGRFNEALRFLYVALLLELHQRKVLRVEKWKTNRAYLREIAANNPEILSPMKELTGVFNACCYGNKEIDEACMNIWFQFYIEEKGKNEKQN